MSVLKLDAIAFDAGTQIRAALDPQLVTDYADAMTSGAQFPPIVVFHDGSAHYLADGFHRFMAAQRNQWREIDAEIRPGTKEDALWFALGANKANGKRLSEADKKHAIVLAFQAWPDRSQRDIAAQIGCSQQYVQQLRVQVTSSCHLPDRVTGKDGKSYPASRKRPERDTPARDVPLGKTRADVQQRRERMQAMASEGHSSRQIAAALGLSEEGCRATMRDAGIDVPADRVMRNTRRVDANRILEHIVSDAENLTEGAQLIDYAAVDPDRLGEWIDSLVASHKKLASFIRQLKDHHREQTEVVA
jgi:hypothetical protein